VSFQDDITPLKAATAAGNIDAVTLLLQFRAVQDKNTASDSAAGNVNPAHANRFTLTVSIIHSFLISFL